MISILVIGVLLEKYLLLCSMKFLDLSGRVVVCILKVLEFDVGLVIVLVVVSVLLDKLGRYFVLSFFVLNN